MCTAVIISLISYRFKGTDPLKIDQIFQFFFSRKVYTFSSSFIWYDNHYRGATRSTSGRGTKVARSLRKEAQCRSDWRVFYFILFILYFFSPFTTLQYLIFSTINCPKTSQVAPDDTPTFEWRASVCGEAVPNVSGLLLNILLFCFFLSLKLFTGRNFEARTLRFVLFGSLRVS